MHPALLRLTRDLGWPLISTMTGFEVFRRSPDTHALFVPGDPARNPETTDVAVILPELHRAFGARFDCAILSATLEEKVREATGVFKTPSVIFFRDGARIGDIQKVRDWDDYLARTRHILAAPALAG